MENEAKERAHDWKAGADDAEIALDDAPDSSADKVPRRIKVQGIVESLGGNELPKTESRGKGDKSTKKEDAHNGDLLGKRDLKTRDHKNGKGHEDDVDDDVDGSLTNVEDNIVNTV